MNNRDLIYASFQTIEENIETSMTIPDLANQYGFSSYYYSRLFKGITGISPKHYIHGRKLTLSASDLLSSQMKIIDIAFKYGFGSHEVYTRAFRKMFGLSPSAVRKNNSYPIERSMKPLSSNRIKQMEHLVASKPEIIIKEEMKLVGIQFYYDLQLKNDLSQPWEHLMSQVDKIKNKIMPERYYQFQYWFPNQDYENIYFFVAVEVSKYEDVPVQLTEKTVAKQQYLKFKHKGLSNQVSYTYQYIYNEYLPDTNYLLPYTFNFEHYGQEYLGPYNPESISDIYIPIDLNGD